MSSTPVSLDILDGRDIDQIHVNIFKSIKPSHLGEFNVSEIEESIIRLVEYVDNLGYDHTIYNGNSSIPEKVKDFIKDCVA